MFQESILLGAQFVNVLYLLKIYEEICGETTPKYLLVALIFNKI